MHFTRATMPAHWLEAVLQNGESYRRRDKSVAMDFQSLRPAMATEFAWAIERQVQLGMNIDAEATAKLAPSTLAIEEHALRASAVEGKVGGAGAHAGSF